MTAPALLLALPRVELSGLVGVAYRVIQALGVWGVGA